MIPKKKFIFKNNYFNKNQIQKSQQNDDASIEEEQENRKPKKSKHVVLSMLEIKDHEIEKKKDPSSMRFLLKRKSFEMNEYPSKQMIEKLNEDENQNYFYVLFS